MATFAERLKSLRAQHGVTQKELALAISVSRSTVAGYEAASKNREPDFELVGSIAAFFGVSADYLLGHTDEPDSANVDADTRMPARRLRAIRESRNLTRQNLAYELSVDTADLIRYEVGADAIPDEFLDRLAEVFDVDRDYFTGALPKEDVEEILGKTLFEAPVNIAPQTKQCIRDFIDFMVERDKRRRR